MAKLPVFATVGLAFSDTLRFARAMPILMIAAVTLSGAYAWIDWAFGIWESGAILTGKLLLIRLAVGVGDAILLAPVQIAIFRFIILDEVTRGYRLDRNSTRFQLFCGWSIAWFMLTFAFHIVPRVPGIESDVRTALDWLQTIAALAVGVSLALLFPAIAVDAPGVTLRNAFVDLRSSLWRGVGILLLMAIPIVAIFAIGIFAILEVTKIDLTDAVWWLASLFWELAWTAAAARLIWRLGTGCVRQSRADLVSRRTASLI